MVDIYAKQKLILMILSQLVSKQFIITGIKVIVKKSHPSFHWLETKFRATKGDKSSMLTYHHLAQWVDLTLRTLVY